MSEAYPVRGVAIRPCISLNGIKYLKEELIKFAPTLVDKPILKDHNHTTENTIGLVTEASASSDGVVSYSGWVKDDGKGTLERIQDRRIKEVSIGAFCKRIVRESDDSDVYIAQGMYGMEISTTPTPGVKRTSLKMSLESINTLMGSDAYVFCSSSVFNFLT